MQSIMKVVDEKAKEMSEIKNKAVETSTKTTKSSGKGSKHPKKSKK